MDYPFTSMGPFLHALSLVMLLLMAAVALVGVLYLASLPGRVAVKRHHPQASSVNICGWLGLPTVIVWIAAMVWAYWRYPQNSDLAAGSLSSSEHQDISKQIAGLEQLVAQLEHSQSGGAR